ncbi:MAG: Flp pilus assembly protein CpaB [Methylococcales bacterium]|nr:Flp pilus assembly protein CpaB [Methylococcales bacterium]
MNSRFLIMLVIALILAGGAAMMAKQWVESQTGNQPVNPEANMLQVYAAATDIPFASRVENTQIKLIAWPKNNVPAQAFTVEDIKKDPNAIVGKVTQRDFYTDEIFLKPQLKEHAGGSTLSALIQEGKRAISVRVDDVVGVAGFILPGNKADIIVSGTGSKIVCQSKAPGYRIIPITTVSSNETYTLLPNIKILAIDQLASQAQDKPAVVRALTLEVDPTQAECLVQAMRTGTLQFTLRNPTDNITAMAMPEAPPVNPPVISPAQIKPEKPYKARLSLKVLPWGSQKFIECENGAC